MAKLNVLLQYRQLLYEFVEVDEAVLSSQLEESESAGNRDDAAWSDHLIATL